MRRNALALLRLAVGAALVFGAMQVIAPGPAHAATAVTINGAPSCSGSTFCYSPSAATVASGDTVTWTNQSGTAHTVTRCDAAACSGTDGGTGTDPAFDHSVAANNGATATQTFTGAGTYNYYCKIHGFGVMHGTVTVQGQTGATTTTTASGSTTSAPTASTTPASTPPTTAPATATAPAAPATAVQGQVNFTG
jgi:plastocyanin